MQNLADINLTDFWNLFYSVTSSRQSTIWVILTRRKLF